MEAQLLQAVTGLKGAIFEDIYEAGQQTHIVIRMERRTHPCPGMRDAYRFRPRLSGTAGQGFPRLRPADSHPPEKRRYACRSCGKRFAETVSFLPGCQRTIPGDCPQMFSKG